MLGLGPHKPYFYITSALGQSLLDFANKQGWRRKKELTFSSLFSVASLGFLFLSAPPSKAASPYSNNSSPWHQPAPSSQGSRSQSPWASTRCHSKEDTFGEANTGSLTCQPRSDVCSFLPQSIGYNKSCGLSQDGAGECGEQKSLVGNRVSDVCSVLSTDQLLCPVRLGPHQPPPPPQELLRCTLEMPTPMPTESGLLSQGLGTEFK